MNILKEKYQKEVVPTLMKELGLHNVMQVPRITKVVVNIGLGEALDNPKALEAASGDLAKITGQKPVITKARKSIAAFKLREGRAIGTMVTLRGERMWSFLDRLMNIVLPRVRDFRGVSAEAFDGRGNYTLGLREQIIFPEIEYDKVDKVRGMEITIVTTAPTDDQAVKLLQLLGMPFRKD
ncbi:LSU ribosomal protein L5P [Bellilinea caldifistulae]|jgi:large subunit ribosomal protein L5|uniref:Large ribosomal subunit protein uL5 n=2 Tax=Bellilinea TaxID=475960 RepID=A0A0P6XGY9_9CHLR|nr:50S ribosomal protein L5 [Bellilinea caldifistulae]KPL74167.1 50S ribosomal protein L5 [Bellilinea caldifistulae]GAP10346.1 LSU ribosomal protein L5P [Bellilinea caldifistulae]